MLDGEESEIQLIDHPADEMSVRKRSKSAVASIRVSIQSSFLKTSPRAEKDKEMI